MISINILDISKKIEDTCKSLSEFEQYLKQQWDLLQKENNRLKEEEKRLKNERDKLDRDTKRLQHELRKFEIEKEFAKEMNSNLTEKVTLNVGGKIIETTRSTLTRVKDSLLATMFGGQHRIARDKEGHHFLDRDPKYFKYVINYLRTQRLDLPNPSQQPLYSCVVHEFDYFSIPVGAAPRPDLLHSARVLFHTFHHKCFAVRILDRRRIATIGLGNIRIWNLSTGKMEKEIKIDPEMAHASDNAVDMDGGWLLWGGRDGDGKGGIWMCNLETEEIKVIHGHSDTVSCITAQDGFIFSGSKDKTIKIWSTQTTQNTKTLTGHEDVVCTLDVDLSKDLLVSGSYDETIKLWSITKGLCQKTLRGHSDTVRAIKIHQNLIISGSFDKSIRAWDMDTGQCLRMLSGHSDWVSCLCVVENAIISGGWDKTIRIWSVDGKCHKVLEEGGAVSCLNVNSDYIVSAADKKVKVWTAS